MNNIERARFDIRDMKASVIIKKHPRTSSNFDFLFGKLECFVNTNSIKREIWPTVFKLRLKNTTDWNLQHVKTGVRRAITGYSCGKNVVVMLKKISTNTKSVRRENDKMKWTFHKGQQQDLRSWIISCVSAIWQWVSFKPGFIMPKPRHGRNFTHETCDSLSNTYSF